MQLAVKSLLSPSNSQNNYSLSVTLLHEPFDFGMSTLSSRVGLKHLSRALAVSPGVQDVEISSSPQSKDSESTSEAGELKMKIRMSGDKTQTIYDNVFSRLVEAAQPIPGFRRVKGEIQILMCYWINMVAWHRMASTYTGKTPNKENSSFASTMEQADANGKLLGLSIMIGILKIMLDNMYHFTENLIKGKSLSIVGIPKEVLLHILGPSKVNKEAIKKIINTSVAECVANEKLEVTKDLKIEESYEELEVAFQPGQDFSFNAIVQLRKTNSKKH
ncbi:hypothetical protein ACLOJK_011817 [Asimina triloba]